MMTISVLERELVDHLKASVLATRVRRVETLPDLDANNLVKKFSNEAPAIYVSYAGGTHSQHVMERRFGIACVARNSRGHDAARHGDAQTIGLYELIDVVESLLDGTNTGTAAWSVRGDTEINAEKLFNAGIYGAVIDLQTRVDIDNAVDESELDAFETFHAEHSMAAGEDEPDAIDEVTLEQ